MLIQKRENNDSIESTTGSLCPVCKKPIRARIFEENGRVMISKSCEEHGDFKEVYWSDADLYLKAKRYAIDGVGVDNPLIEGKSAADCPFVCGLCNAHKSHTALAIIDLTNRCNQSCAVCFANANAKGYVYEPSFEEIVSMLDNLRAIRPVPCPAVQFSGGEPTIYPRFIDAIRKAKELGFAQIQVATNGLRFVDRDFLQEAINAGLNTMYLHFDGMDEKVYEGSGGKRIFDAKFRVIENCGSTTPHLSTVLVPTIVNGQNDDQIWPTIRFAFDHLNPVLGVNFQPVAFAGRINDSERAAKRFTIPDLVKRIERDSEGAISAKDFYPVPSVAQISEILSLYDGIPKLTLTVHPHCGMATYVFKGDDGSFVPITEFVDVDGFLERIGEIAADIENSRARKVKLVAAAPSLFRYIDRDRAPVDFRGILTGLLRYRNKKALAELHWKALFIGAMHFQDGYNYDIERVMRCQIHYAVPDGRIIPFCAYNSGPEFREEVEMKFSVPLEAWRERQGEEP